MKKILFLIFIFIFCSRFALAQEKNISDLSLELAKAHFYYSKGEYNEALSALDGIIKLDPQNLEAYQVLNLCYQRLYEKEVQACGLTNEEKVGALLSSIRNAKRVLYEDDKLRDFSNRLTIGGRRINAGSSADTDFDKRGFNVSEQIRWNTFFSGYDTTLLADLDYFANSHNDVRLRNLTYKLRNDDSYLILGDNISNFSRYLIRGVKYKGLNFKMETSKNELEVLGGVAKYFDVNENEYIYPREVYGIYDTYSISDRYNFGFGAHFIKDSNSIRDIDSANNPKENIVLGFSQKFTPFPNIWEIEAESAYSRTDLDRTDEDILDKNITLKDFAHYVKSDLKFKDIRLSGSYEKVGADFRSLVGLSAKNYRVPASAISADREHIYSSLTYTGIKYFDFNLNFSRTQNNLDDDTSTARTRQKSLSAYLKLNLPKEFPQIGLRSSYLNSISIPGSASTSDDEIYRDFMFEFTKEIYGVNWDGYYLNRKFIENIDTFGTYTNLYTLRGSKTLFDKYLVSGAYCFSKSYKDVSGSASRLDREKFADLDVSWNIYKNANILFGLNLTNIKEYGTITDAYNTYSYSTIFSWPYAKYFCDGSRFSISPYLSLHNSEARDTTTNNRDRFLVSASLQASYSPNIDNEISLFAEYRRDADDEVLYEETKDFRAFLSWKALFGP